MALNSLPWAAPPSSAWDGTGFYVKSRSNADAIHNGGPNAAIPSDPEALSISLPSKSGRVSNVRVADFRIKMVTVVTVRPETRPPDGSAAKSLRSATTTDAMGLCKMVLSRPGNEPEHTQ